MPLLCPVSVGYGGGILRFRQMRSERLERCFFAYKYFIFVYKQLLDMEISFL